MLPSEINRVRHLFDARTQETVITALVSSKLYQWCRVWSTLQRKKKCRKGAEISEFCGYSHHWSTEILSHNTSIKRVKAASLEQLPEITVGVVASMCMKGLAPSYVYDRHTTCSFVHGRNTVKLVNFAIASISGHISTVAEKGLPSANFQLRTSDFRFQISDLRLRTSDFELRTSNFGLRTSDFELRTSDFGLQTSDIRPQTWDSRLPSSDFQLPSSDL